MTINIFDKENSNIMRGIAILSIMLHNFFHYGFSFANENEMSFSQAKADLFFSTIYPPSWDIIGHLFSFLGWIGVPVFVFLTGYGLSIKYPHQNTINTIAYLKHNYLKLLFLLIPAMLFFVSINLLNGNLTDIGIKLISLSMLQNLCYPLLKINPEVYWYFSLTFQFYLIFLLFRKTFNTHVLLAISILSIIIMGFLGQSDFVNGMSIYRHCATGWFPLFAMGVWWANKNQFYQFSNSNIITDTIFFIVSFVLTISMNTNYVSWLFVPIISLLMFVYLSRIIARFTYTARIFKYLGYYSAVIFVTHPIARATYYILLNLNIIKVHHILYALTYYIIMTLALSYFYKKYYTFIIWRRILRISMLGLRRKSP